MEIARIEMQAVQNASEKASADIQELGELELCLVGGGCGEVVFG